jgi:hypothetical protein
MSLTGNVERYRMLRFLFVLGYVLNIILWFLPYGRVSSELGQAGGGGKMFSTLDLVRLLSQTSPGWTLFFVLVFTSNILFIVLALIRPKRWIFLVASSLAGIFFIWNLFSATPQGIEYLFIPRLLSYVASCLTLLGFLVNPPAMTVMTPNTAAPADQQASLPAAEQGIRSASGKPRPAI